MLFKALVRRLNGGTDSSSTRASSPHRRSSGLIYNKYTSLPGLLIRMLRQSSGEQITDVDEPGISASMQAQRVFPALEIIEVSGLPHQQSPEIKQLIRNHMESSAWPIRDKAAKALGLVIPDSAREAEIKELLRPDWPSQNALHGRLLYIRYILSRSKAHLSNTLIGKYATSKGSVIC